MRTLLESELFPHLVLNIRTILDKVSGPNLVAYVNRTLVCDWWVIRHRCKSKHHDDMLKRYWTACLSLITILGSTIIIIWGGGVGV